MTTNKTIEVIERYKNYNGNSEISVDGGETWWTREQFKKVKALITEARIDEQTNTGGDLDGSVYFRTKKGWSSQEDRLKQLKENK